MSFGFTAPSISASPARTEIRVLVVDDHGPLPARELIGLERDRAPILEVLVLDEAVRVAHDRRRERIPFGDPRLRRHALSVRNEHRGTVGDAVAFALAT